MAMEPLETSTHEGADAAVFFGVVHPQGGGWTFDEPIEVPFDDGVWTVILVASQFRVAVRGVLPSDLASFRNEVLSIVQGCLDALGFCLATPLTPSSPAASSRRTECWFRI